MANENPNFFNAALFGQLDPSRAWNNSVGSIGNIIRGGPNPARPMAESERSIYQDIGKNMASSQMMQNPTHWLQGLSHVVGRASGMNLLGKTFGSQNLAAIDQANALTSGTPNPVPTGGVGVVPNPPNPTGIDVTSQGWSPNIWNFGN